MLHVKLFKVPIAVGTDGMADVQLSVSQHAVAIETLPPVKVRLPS